MSQRASGISIITPFYNTGPVFWETYDCITNQSFTNWEWIIINDGSNDIESIAILDKLTNEGNPKIKIVNLEWNIGLPGARNRGIEHSSKPYLAFIDSDDLFDEYALEKFFLVLENNRDIQFVNSWVKGFGGQNYEWKGGFHETHIFLQENRNTSCFMSRKEVFEWISFDENLRNGGEDWDFWLHAASKGIWGYTIPEFLTWYRRKEGPSEWKSLSSEAEIKKLRNLITRKYRGLNKDNFPQRGLSEYRFEKVSLNNNEDAKQVTVFEKKILFILPWFELGGADKFNLDLVEGLNKKDWQISIACTKPGDQPWEGLFKQHTKDIFYFPNYSLESGFYNLLEHLIVTRKPSVIFISNTVYGYFAIPFVRQRFPHIPVVDYLHCEDPGWFNGGYPTFSSIFTRLLDKTFVSSEHLKNWCIKLGAIRERITVSYTNIDSNLVKRDPETRNKLRDTLGIPVDCPVILYVARLTEQKQPLLLLEAIEKLYEKNRDFKLIVIGDGPDKALFQKKLKRLKARKNIIYLGSLSNSEVKEYMDASDIFFLPTAFEGIALSIFEAMAKELPVVAAQVGGQSELVTDGCGFLVKPTNPVQDAGLYADHLNHLVKYPQFRIETGKRAQQRVQQFFRLDSMVSGIEAALKEVLLQHELAVPLITAEYVAILNRMSSLDQTNRDLQGELTNTVNTILKKYNKQYSAIKKVGKKLKSTVKKFS